MPQHNRLDPEDGQDELDLTYRLLVRAEKVITKAEQREARMAGSHGGSLAEDFPALRGR